MNASQKKRRDFLQNLLIVLLSLSAALLFLQSQIYNIQDGSGAYLGKFFSSPQSTLPGVTAPAELRGLSVPLRIRVTDAYGSSGSLALTTKSDSFSSLRPLLGEALGSADGFSPCEPSVFREALQQHSAYFDFLNSLPLSYLAGLAGADPSDQDLSARRLVVSFQDQEVWLCLQDSANHCWISRTAVSQETFLSALKDFQAETISFAYEQAESDPMAAALAPYTLLPDTPPQLPLLTAQNPMTSVEPLLTALGLNPHTNNRYTESSGTEVIMEGERTLRISPDGRAVYESGSHPELQIHSSQELPSLEEAVIWGSVLVKNLPGNLDNAADPYLSSFQQTGDTTRLRFDYHLNGVPLRFADGSCAAEILLVGRNVSTMHLHLCQYRFNKEPSLLLPLRQTLAIAAQTEDAELFLGYLDRGQGSVSASWLLE